MPVILEEEALPVRLGKEAGDRTGLLAPCAFGVIRLWPTSRAVNTVRNNWVRLLEEAVDGTSLAPAEALVAVKPASDLPAKTGATNLATHRADHFNDVPWVFCESVAK